MDNQELNDEIATDIGEWCVKFINSEKERSPAKRYFRCGVSKAQVEREAQVDLEMANALRPRYTKFVVVPAADELGIR